METMIGELLGDRYQIIELLATKAGRRTLLAKDLRTEKLVAVKLLTFDTEFSWEDLKLFEREVQTLKSISHPAIPRYLDYFDWDSDRGKHLALVQSYIEGESLEKQVQEGRHFTESEIKDIARQLLEILIYLHGLNPPVIHRDIKPSNIILANRSGNSVGQVYLVDFGSVQTASAKVNGTMTVVGTYGYMPPEQFGGRVVAASDLYSLGATIVFLATGIHPANLPEVGEIYEFTELTNLSDELNRWLHQMLEFSLKRRFPNAQAALNALENPGVKQLATLRKGKPDGSKIFWKKTTNSCQLIIPARTPELDALELVILAICGIGATIIGIPFALFLFYTTLASLFAGWLAFLFSAGALAIALLLITAGFLYILDVLFSMFGKIHLQIVGKSAYVNWMLWGVKYQKHKPFLKSHIDKISYDPNSCRLILWAGFDKCELVVNRMETVLSEREVEWIAQELSQWLQLPLTAEE